MQDFTLKIQLGSTLPIRTQFLNLNLPLLVMMIENNLFINEIPSLTAHCLFEVAHFEN
jgi:hypothetical protein